MKIGEKNRTLNDIRTRALRRSKYSFGWPRVRIGNCNRPQRVRDRTCPSIRDCHHTQSAIGSIRQVSFSDCLNHSCFDLLFTLWVATLTYSLANIHSRPSLLNWHVVWVYFKTYILSRSMSNQTPSRPLDDWEFLNKPSKSIHISSNSQRFRHGFQYIFHCILPTGTARWLYAKLLNYNVSTVAAWHTRQLSSSGSTWRLRWCFLDGKCLQSCVIYIPFSQHWIEILVSSYKLLYIRSLCQ